MQCPYNTFDTGNLPNLIQRYRIIPFAKPAKNHFHPIHLILISGSNSMHYDVEADILIY